ncbi:uncharacterized protein [Littorina saxatilis]|uniref:Fibrinogen C-terminal domain-containing protein n=1 Tax=Littorina saxatilis TaxID=31220 RepID=A0AAN9GBZ0_9CAEN
MEVSAILLFVLFGLNHVKRGSTVQLHLYTTCPIPNTIGQEPDTVIGRSELQCVMLCSQSEHCLGVRVCGETGMVKCTMRNTSSPAQCLQPDRTPTHCRLVNRVSPCEKGGTPNGHGCLCPLPFAGKYCQRYMRDCSEGYDNGNEGAPEGMYLIQPMTSPAPFPVVCLFTWGGITKAVWRFVAGTSWAATTWSQAKQGIGYNRSAVPDYTRVFVGLDHLHQLLNQSSYQNVIQSSYGSDWDNMKAFYTDFHVGPEPSGYELSYGTFYSYDEFPALNGLKGQGPMLFAAPGGPDPYGCVAGGAPTGWYGGSHCAGHSVFADPPTWPSPDKGVQVVRMIQFSLVRKGPYIEN